MADYSMFNYVTAGELPNLIPSMSSVTNSGLAAKFISDAEAMVDALAGPAPKFYPNVGGHFAATVASGATGVSASIFGSRRPNYWAVGGIYLRVVDSTETSIIGQARLIVASGPTDEAVTLSSGFAAAAPSGTEFVVEQNSAFPRAWDIDPWGSPVLPFLLDRAVAAQVEYGIMAGSESGGLGSSNLVTDADGGVTSRTYGSGYSESRDASRRTGLAVFISPRTRTLMQAGHLINVAGYL